MRIAMVVDTPDMAVDSPDLLQPRHQATQLARALHDLGYTITLYTRRDSPDAPTEESITPGLPLRRLAAGPNRPLTAAEFLNHVADLGQQLAATWADEPPDVIHAHSWTSALAALVARRATGISVVATIPSHDIDPCADHGTDAGRSAAPDHTRAPTDAKPRPARLERAIRHDVDYLITTSQAAQHQIRADGTPASKIAVIPRGVDVDHFHPDGDRPPVNGTRLVCPAIWDPRHDLDDPRNGISTAVTALRAVPDVELVVACAGPAAERISQLRRTPGLGQNRLRVMAELNDQTVAPLLRSADLVLCLGTRDVAGTWALEAMACARPVVANDVGGWTETLIDGVTGMLIRPGDADGLTRAIRDLLSDPIRLTGYGVTGRERAQARYAWARVADETAQVYARLRSAVGSP